MCNIYPLSVIQVINVYLPLAITRHKGNSMAINVELELQQRHTILKVRHRHGSYRINQRSLSISAEKLNPTRDRLKVTTSGFNTLSLIIQFSLPTMLPAARTSVVSTVLFHYFLTALN